MAYPFRKMTTRELRKLSRDNRNKNRIRKIEQDMCSVNERKIKSQEDICKN